MQTVVPETTCRLGWERQKQGPDASWRSNQERAGGAVHSRGWGVARRRRQQEAS